MISTDAPGADGVLVRTVPLGGGTLSLSLQRAGADHAWLAPRPHTIAGWREHLHTVRASQSTDWLQPLLSAIAPTGRAAERLLRAAAHGVVITTGQQPGLFGGPAYTWSKAMSALALADVLERETGMPVAPVFWAATDDADWAEAAETHAVTPRGLMTMSLAGPPTDGVAMADVLLGDVTAPLSQLREACGSVAHASILERVESAYVPHATVGASYVQLLRSILEPMGIAVIDASHAALRTAADPVLRRALAHAQALSDALAERTQRIRDDGFSPQVEPLHELSLVFHSRRGTSGRERVKERIPIADASRMVREADEGSLGANVLLRPVLERALLPTACYVAGPGELAYFAQVTAVATALQAVVPVVAPRWAGEVIDAGAMAAFARLEVDRTLLDDPHALEHVLADRLVDEGLRDAIERLRVAMETQVRALRDAVTTVERVASPEVIAGLQQDLSRRLERFERRVRAGVKRSESGMMQQAAYLRASLRPQGASPERILNLMPMLARFGTQVLTRMYDAAAAHAQTLVQGTADSA